MMNADNAYGREAVYVIEDDAAVRLGCSQALALEGIGVREFEDAESALAALKRDPPAAIVSDVRLPGMGGLALLDSMKAHPGTPTYRSS